MNQNFAVAVDGPAGSGKSTAAKGVARRLGILYIDTGAMYRTLGYACIQQGVNPACEAEVASVLEKMDMQICPQAGGQRMLLDGEDITAAIRTEEIGKAASVVGAYRKVREKMVEIQQALAKENSVIMDGRDIGTKVLPEAQVKIYLDASMEERTKRRVGELQKQGKHPDEALVRKEMEERDYQDTHRKYSPLRKAEDAVMIDTTGMDIAAVTEAMLSVIAKQIK